MRAWLEKWYQKSSLCFCVKAFLLATSFTFSTSAISKTPNAVMQVPELGQEKASKDKLVSYLSSIELMYYAEKMQFLALSSAENGEINETETKMAVAAIKILSELLRPATGGQCGSGNLGNYFLQIEHDAHEIISLNPRRKLLRESTDTILAQVPILQDLSGRLVDRLILIKHDHNQLAIAQRQSWLAERFRSSAYGIYAGDEQSVKYVDLLGRDAMLFRAVTSGMQTGNDKLGINAISDKLAIDILHEIDIEFGKMSELPSGILDSFIAEYAAIKSGNKVLEQSKKIEDVSRCIAASAVKRSAP